ncbi:antileukoproteinase-like [Talpa occidentalis]|uniref:antileukoproteinase-like n=1 Tax=Talpa occidentalis TaxID=50954 RepID=UPI00188FEAEC|nr:antileukoproteinase-like [Talpa occidentalis]
MKSSGLLLLALLVLGTLASWAVESARESVKGGECPRSLPASCTELDETECQSDWKCSGKKRCCVDRCSMKCQDPVKLSYPGTKPGRCPTITGHCKMLNPPNHCETDGDCTDHFKCCEGRCGKACFAPV